MIAAVGRAGFAAPLTVCLDYRPELGGLVRGVCDLANAVNGRVISLDSLPASCCLDDAPIPAGGLSRLSVSQWALRGPLSRLPRPVELALDHEISQAPLVIVHSLYRSHLPAIARLCQRRQVPYCVVTHGMLDPWVFSRNTVAKHLWMWMHGRPCLRNATAVLFSTAAEREKARPAYDGPNIAVIPWPVEIPKIEERSAARAALRSELRVSQEAKILLWLGRYDSLKRPVAVIEAFARGAPGDWVLVMAGFPGDVPRERVEAAAQRLAPGRVRVREPATGPEKLRLLLGADGFTSLSWRENYGYAVAEAMAAGLPIIVAPDHDLLSYDALVQLGVACVDHSITSAGIAIAQFCGLTHKQRMDAGQRARDWAAAHLQRSQFERSVRALLNAASPLAGQPAAHEAISQQLA